MDIDIERLKWDAEYWDAISPLGATHHWSLSGEWYQDCGDHVLAWAFGKEEWVQSTAPLRIIRPEAIPRPTTPAAPDWGGAGLPPVGSDQTVFVPTTAVSAGGAYHPDSKWLMVAHHNGMGVVCIRESGKGDWRSKMVEPRFCRPIRTQAERDRDDLISTIKNSDDLAFSFRPDDIADAIIAAGWRKPEGN